LSEEPWYKEQSESYLFFRAYSGVPVIHLEETEADLLSMCEGRYNVERDTIPNLARELHWKMRNELNGFVSVNFPGLVYTDDAFEFVKRGDFIAQELELEIHPSRILPHNDWVAAQSMDSFRYVKKSVVYLSKTARKLGLPDNETERAIPLHNEIAEHWGYKKIEEPCEAVIDGVPCNLSRGDLVQKSWWDGVKSFFGW
jgi:hypothetical protein